jgi:hypothetical protein
LLASQTIDTSPLSLHHKSSMADTIHCDTHGDRQNAYVCSHLLGDSAGLGFNRAEPTGENPSPDAWCDDCELIHAAHGGEWTDEAQALVKISVLCSGCYNSARIRNTRTQVKLADLNDLRWKCGSCDEWHTGPILDLSFDSPYYWTKKNGEDESAARLLPDWDQKRPETFLSEDYCAIDNENFFVRGVIHLPIVGTSETFRWGAWGSLSRGNFEKLLEADDDPKRVELPPMFSWLSTKIPEYPDTLNLKMQVHVQEPGSRPIFELDCCDHPLAQQFHHGIMPEGVKEITMDRFGANK